jgi:hypothetical protein
MVGCRNQYSKKYTDLRLGQQTSDLGIGNRTTTALAEWCGPMADTDNACASIKTVPPRRTAFPPCPLSSFAASLR